MILEQIARDTEIRVTQQEKESPSRNPEKSGVPNGDRYRIPL